jgi:transposase
MRTLTGAKQFCAIRSYLSTAPPNTAANSSTTPVMLAEGHPWLAAHA